MWLNEEEGRRVRDPAAPQKVVVPVDRMYDW